MMKRLSKIVRRPRNVVVTCVVVAIAVVGVFVNAGGGTLPDLPTAEVTNGEFVDTLQIRGEIRPLKSVVLAAPMQAGELQIVKLVKSGTVVKPGDVVVEFDGSTLAAHRPGEAVRAEAGRRRDRAVAGAVADHARAERDGADAGEVRPASRQARRRRRATPSPGSRTSRRSSSCSTRTRS